MNKRLSVIKENIDPDVPEYLIDTILSDNVLKEIPVVSLISSSLKIVWSIQDKFLLKKIYSFCYALKSIPQIEKEEFIKKLSLGEEQYQRISEKLLFIIDKSDEIEKMAIIAKIFSKYIKKEIDQDMLFRLCLIVNKIYLEDLLKINNTLSLEEQQALFGVGLMNINKWNMWTMMHLWIPLAGSSFSFVLNEYGLLMKDILIQDI